MNPPVPRPLTHGLEPFFGSEEACSSASSSRPRSSKISLSHLASAPIVAGSRRYGSLLWSARYSSAARRRSRCSLAMSRAGAFLFGDPLTRLSATNFPRIGHRVPGA